MQRGVSLIELMVGMAILAILLATAMPNFTTAIQNTQIRNTGEAILNGLSLARAEAVMRNTQVNFILAAGNSWTVECTSASTNCPGSSPAASATTPSNIQAWNAGSSNAQVNPTAATITFNGMGKSTLSPGTTATFAISSNSGTCVLQGGLMRCLNVDVTSGGRVRMCDPALATSDPQAC